MTAEQNKAIVRRFNKEFMEHWGILDMQGLMTQLTQ